jgi:C4-dicarboxylate transporter DctM subunit
MTIAIAFGLFAGLAILGLPIVWSLVSASFCALVAVGDIPLMLVAQRMIAQIDSFTLLAVPFFVLTGVLMEEGGISVRLVEFAGAMVGHWRGGLATVAVISCLIFAGVSGSSAADASAVGALLIPSMIQHGYRPAAAAALIAAAATMGPIIPPSTLAIIYASLTDVPVAKLFAGGLVPGLMFAAALLIAARFIAPNTVAVTRSRATGRARVRALRRAGPALMVPVIILAGISSGVFTATESGAISALYAFLIATCIHRELRLERLRSVLTRAALITAVVLSVISAAGAMSWFLVREDVPQRFANLVLGATHDPMWVMLLILLCMFVVGCVMEIVAAGVVMIPVIAPLAATVGINPVHFAVLVIMVMALGAVTPPVGVTLFVTLGLARTTLREVNPYIWPLIGVLVLVTLLCALCPPLVTWLPNSLFPHR